MTVHQGAILKEGVCLSRSMHVWALCYSTAATEPLGVCPTLSGYSSFRPMHYMWFVGWSFIYVLVLIIRVFS